MRLRVKKKLGIFLVTVAINLLFGYSMELHAQDSPPVGGYRTASTTDPGVVAAARFAIKKEKQRRGAGVTLVSIERAQTQVVAGTNYKICLRVRIKGRIRSITTIVYRNPQRLYSLTRWKPGACEIVS